MIQRQDVESKLNRRCFDVVCLLGTVNHKRMVVEFSKCIILSSFYGADNSIHLLNRYKSAPIICKTISEDTQEMPQSQSTALPRHQNSVHLLYTYRSAPIICKTISEDTQKMPQSQNTVLPRHQNSVHLLYTYRSAPVICKTRRGPKWPCIVHLITR